MNQVEHEHAKALMEWCCYNITRYPELALLFAIPNGGDRHVAVAAKMKAEGVKAGVPDYFLPVARKSVHGLFIELKAPGGRLKKLQEGWQLDLQKQGYISEVCYGWEEAQRVLVNYLAGNF